MSVGDRTVEGEDKSVSEILSKQRYAIGFYQREYSWTSKQTSELVNDLCGKFLSVHDPVNERRSVAQYPGYFLGPIIVSKKDGESFIVDGQQRLTTLSLFLIYLDHLQRESLPEGDRVSIEDMVVSVKFGEKSFNLRVPERDACVTELYEKGSYAAPADSSKSIQNMVARYEEFDTLFPEELKGDALPYFIDWLKERVQFVRITAFNDGDAYSIFETMNDRGLRLTPSDMLKGFLLANDTDEERRDAANARWREQTQALEKLEADSSADFLKTWLRSQYAVSVRERKRGAVPRDWDRIGTEFHRWVQENSKPMGLTTPKSFTSLILEDLTFYASAYKRILQAIAAPPRPSDSLRFARYNADLGFTLQNQLLLAPLRPGDSAEDVDLKLEIVGRYVNILLARRIWNFRSTAYSTMQYTMFTTMKDIRGLPPADLARVLTSKLEAMEEDFDTQDNLYVHQQNRRQLHRLLARITDYVTTGSGGTSNYAELIGATGVPHDVEHIWADHYERHTDEFNHSEDFARHRNLIGGLLLLPRSFNRSYQDLPYEEKREYYLSQNLLAASLHPRTYERNPGFLRFIHEQGLDFTPHDSFTAPDFATRGKLYREIAKRVWDPEDILRVTSNAPAP